VANKIVYFTGCFANYYSPEMGRALVSVLEKNGIEVIVPKQKCCGMPMMANGNLAGARKKFNYIVNSLKEASFPDIDIITTCPSCNMMLRKEGLSFFDSEAARFVANHIYDAGEFLWRMHKDGRLNTKFHKMPLQVFYHSPCHLNVQNIIDAPIGLLKLIPGITIVKATINCCGMGGSYGMKKQNFIRSREIAGKVWEEAKASVADIAATECGGCGLQIEAGTGMEVVHPLVLLSRAYQ